MRRLLMFVCCVSVLVSLAAAKNTLSSQWICQKPSDAHAIDVGDQPDHSYAVSKTTCTAAKPETNVLKEKEGIGTQFSESTGGFNTWHGVFVVTTEGGDKIYYSYQNVGAGKLKDGQFQSGSNKWSIVGGTGKFVGATGTGMCRGKGNADGTAVWECTGAYTLAK
jgi:hypothetical protein